MGFPLGHPAVLLPKFLLTLFSVLDLFRNIILCLFGNSGRGEFVESYVEWATATPTHQPQHQSSSSTIMRDILPVLRYKDLDIDGQQDSCVFCLYEFQGEEEIRRLMNCRHIFHRNCLDRWIDHDQVTCPLCRTCFVPREMMGNMDTQYWELAAADGAYDILSEYSFTLGSYY